MGFSVSGSFAILVLASFLAFGVFYGAASNGADRVLDAQRSAAEDRLSGQNTEINVTTAAWREGALSDPADDFLEIEAENDGATTLAIPETDVIVDNTYIPREDFRTEWAGSSGNTNTDLWQPGETYHVEINRTILDADLSSLPPERVKLVVETGEADARDIDDLTG